MKRDIHALQNNSFDVLIVGGGIYGAAVAREAAARGLRTALIEQADLCSGTSANSLKIIHGGLRYLQQADLPRVLESIRERSILLRTAPHLVAPMDCLMPTYGLALKSRPVMILGLLINDILSFNRNAGLFPSRRIPAGSTLSRAEILRILPQLAQTRVTGAARWTDAFANDTERLVVAMDKAASASGAVIANYVRAESFLLDGERVTGIRATDRLTGRSLDIRAALVINTASAWSGQLLSALPRPVAQAKTHLALAVNFIVKNWPVTSHSLGLQSRVNSRLYFFAPWRGLTIAGTYYRPFTGSLDALTVTDTDITSFLRALNSCLPGVTLSRDDIVAIHAGVLPCSRPADPDREPALLHHSRIIDHARTDALEGLLSVCSIKYTTARGIAENVIRVAARKLGRRLPPSGTRTTPLPGGTTGDINAFIRAAAEAHPSLPDAEIRRLVSLYGSELADIDALAAARSIPLHQAELLFAIQEEMPQTLGDLLFRRTGAANAAAPSDDLLREAAALMANERGWDTARTEAEIRAVQTAPHLFQPACTPVPAPVAP